MPSLPAAPAKLHTAHPVVDDVLAMWRETLGASFEAYRGHVYRLINFSCALTGDDAASDTLAVAAVFHDLGIWSDGTFAYLAPSIRRADEWSDAHATGVDRREVADMIALHHKLTRAPASVSSNVEPFRRADLVDLSLGLFRFGLPKGFVRTVREAFPNAGFHRVLVHTCFRWLLKHPTNPLPMVRW
jgi:hypothetical protein